MKKGHGKEGYIKAEQFYYFDSSKTDFYVLGNVDPDFCSIDQKTGIYE